MFTFLFYLAGAAGSVANSLRLLGPTSEEVGSVFTDLQPARRLELAHAIAARRISNALLKWLIRWVGPEAFIQRVRCEGEDQFLELTRQGRPVILVPWHAGPLPAIVPALVGLKISALVMQHNRRKPGTSGIEYLHMKGGETRGIRVLKYAVERLRKGGVVLVVVDLPSPPPGPEPGPYRLFGRAVHLMPQSVQLARLGHAAIVPVSPRWDGQEMVVSFSEPIPQPEKDASTDLSAHFDQEMLASLAAWWEHFLKEHPEELWTISLCEIAGAPPLKE